jgi:hypothetical protein
MFMNNIVIFYVFWRNQSVVMEFNSLRLLNLVLPVVCLL